MFSLGLLYGNRFHTKRDAVLSLRACVAICQTAQARGGSHVEVGRTDSDPTEATAIDGQQPNSLCVARTGAIGATSECALLVVCVAAAVIAAGG